jgi:hypothetical protein
MYSDDPDIDDEMGESDVAKAIMQALRLRRKYMVESKQDVPYNVTNALETLRSHKMSRVELHPRYAQFLFVCLWPGLRTPVPCLLSRMQHLRAH